MVAILTENNFLIYAAQHYQNLQCQNTEEFVDDIRRLKYIRKLITRYQKTGDLKERLILNHFIVLSNVFEPEVLCRIVFLKLEKQMKFVKPFLLLLNLLPNRVINVKEERVIDTSDIPMDDGIVEALRKI